MLITCLKLFQTLSLVLGHMIKIENFFYEIESNMCMTDIMLSKKQSLICSKNFLNSITLTFYDILWFFFSFDFPPLFYVSELRIVTHINIIA